MKSRDTTYPIVITGIGSVHFAPERFLGKRGFKFFSSATRYALAAAKLALEDSGLLETTIYTPESKGVFVGTNFGVHDVVEAMDALVLTQGAGALMAIETPNFSANIPASYVSLKHGFLAFNVTLTNMLVAGVEAVMLGAQSIQNGRAEVVLAGATEGAIPARGAALLGGSASAGAACMLVLEALPAAQSRGARIYAQVGANGLCFIPPETAETAQSWQQHESLLRRQLDRLLSDHSDQRVLPLAMLDLDSPFVQRLNESVLRYLKGRRITANRDPPASGGAADACVSPLEWLSASIAQHGEALLVVASPQGHVAFLSLEPIGSPRARTGLVSTQIPAVSRV